MTRSTIQLRHVLWYLKNKFNREIVLMFVINNIELLYELF